MVQWLRIPLAIQGKRVSFSGERIKIPYAMEQPRPDAVKLKKKKEITYRSRWTGGFGPKVVVYRFLI